MLPFVYLGIAFSSLFMTFFYDRFRAGLKENRFHGGFSAFACLFFFAAFWVILIFMCFLVVWLETCSLLSMMLFSLSAAIILLPLMPVGFTATLPEGFLWELFWRGFY